MCFIDWPEMKENYLRYWSLSVAADLQNHIVLSGCSDVLQSDDSNVQTIFDLRSMEKMLHTEWQ